MVTARPDNDPSGRRGGAMPGWQIPGVLSVPSVAELLRMMQLHFELMTELPETMAELTRAVRGLAATVETAKETVDAANRVAERLESLLDELHDPVHGLRPGIERITGAGFRHSPSSS